MDRPVWPCSRRKRNRSLVSLAVANPLYWRIVQKRPRYRVGWTPRVNGYSPGKLRSFRYSTDSVSIGVYSLFTGIPDTVSNFSRRSGNFPMTFLTTESFHFFSARRSVSFSPMIEHLLSDLDQELSYEFLSHSVWVFIPLSNLRYCLCIFRRITKLLKQFSSQLVFH